MATSPENIEVTAVDVSCTDHQLEVVLTDGRIVSVPLAWFPRLSDATPKQKAQWELIGGGIGIHWECLDEDISIASLLRPEQFMSMEERPTEARSKSIQKRKSRGRSLPRKGKVQVGMAK